MSLQEGPAGGLGAETIYGTHEDSQLVMSEKVQSLAGSIYQEFERMIARYDEDVVKTLMPQLVTVLECLDAAYQRNQEHDVELELLREDNEQLVTQYEREKAARKQAEQKLLEIEDMAEGERKELSGRLEALESIVRMLELKHKNSLEHASRLEERENELKKEYAKLHDRYTDLFKNHVDYMDRTKLLLGPAGERGGDCRNRMGMHPMNRSSGPISFGFASLENAVSGIESAESIIGSPTSTSPSPLSPPLGDELAAVRTMERAHQTDPIIHHSQATSPVAPQNNNTVTGRTQTKHEQRSGNTLYQELSFQDSDANLAEGDDSGDITGSWVHPGEYASSVNDNYFGMGKEVENLIMENNELLATKNALNVVKDDLIAKVDELVGELEILREEVTTVNMARQRLKDHIVELEEDLRRLKEEGAANVSAAKSSDNVEESDVPLAQRKKFTRVEMARVLMERNQYKERFIELQDAVRYTEIVRANRCDALDKKQSFLQTFFNRLFNSSERPPRPLSSPQLKHQSLSVGSGSRMRQSHTQADFLERRRQSSDKIQQRKKLELRDQYRQVRAHVKKEDGRLQAYGWSLPGRPPTVTSNVQSSSSSSSSGLPVPVPVFCRPLTETNPGMKFLCGVGVYKKDNKIGDMISTNSDKNTDGVISLADEIRGATNTGSPLKEATSNLSLVWICSSTHTNSTVMVINANNPAEILETFSINDRHLLCIASVGGNVSEEVIELPSENVSTTPTVAEGDSTQQAEVCSGAVTLVTVNKGQTQGDTQQILESRLKTDVEKPSDTKLPTDDANEVDENYKFGEGKPFEDNNRSNPDELCDTGEIKISNSTFEQEAVKSSPSSQSPPLNNTPPNEPPVTPKYTTATATMWLGAQSGMLYIHSAIGEWSICLGSIRLKDAVLYLVQCNTRVVAALANGTVAVFARCDNGLWDLNRYHLITLSAPQHSVRCLAMVGSTVWCGFRSKVAVLEPASLTLLQCLDTHPRKDSQVRQLACSGHGVWVSIRLDSTLRLYHARTYQHLQDVDIEPYVSKMLGTGKLGFSFVRITALLVASARLWIGTGNGVIISIPLSDPYENDSRSFVAGPGSVVRINSAGSGVSLPYCSMAHAQLSFHGHRDAVKFFVAVPGADSPTSSMLVMSAGEGYIDFRIDDGDMEESVVLSDSENAQGDGDMDSGSMQQAKFGHDHLIVWQVATP